MKKINLKDFFMGALVSGLIFGGIGVAAITLTADQIKYTPSDENFKATNVEEALNEVYKISEYEIPADTYFYDSKTEGENIVRYRKVEGKYYLCDKNGKITSEDEQDVSNITLTEYTATNELNIIHGQAGYASGNLYLGNMKSNSNSIKDKLSTSYNWSISNSSNKLLKTVQLEKTNKAIVTINCGNRTGASLSGNITSDGIITYLTNNSVDFSGSTTTVKFYTAIVEEATTFSIYVSSYGTAGACAYNYVII